MPTVCTFLHQYLDIWGRSTKQLGGTRGEDVRSFASYIAKQVLQSYRFLEYKPSTVAAACTSLGLLITGNGSWNITLQRHTGYKTDLFEECTRAILLYYWTALVFATTMGSGVLDASLGSGGEGNEGSSSSDGSGSNTHTRSSGRLRPTRTAPTAAAAARVGRSHGPSDQPQQQPDDGWLWLTLAAATILGCAAAAAAAAAVAASALLPTHEYSRAIRTIRAIRALVTHPQVHYVAEHGPSGVAHHRHRANGDGRLAEWRWSCASLTVAPSPKSQIGPSERTETSIAFLVFNSAAHPACK